MLTIIGTWEIRLNQTKDRYLEWNKWELLRMLQTWGLWMPLWELEMSDKKQRLNFKKDSKKNLQLDLKRLELSAKEDLWVLILKREPTLSDKFPTIKLLSLKTLALKTLHNHTWMVLGKIMLTPSVLITLLVVTIHLTRRYKDLCLLVNTPNSNIEDS